MGGEGNSGDAEESGQFDLPGTGRSGSAPAETGSKYILAEQLEARLELYETEDAELLLVGYGIVSRVLRSAVEEAESKGLKVGLFRPITLWPFPNARCNKRQRKRRKSWWWN